jgi:hypothetical protein
MSQGRRQHGDAQPTRREWLRVVAAAPLAATPVSERLNVLWDGDNLRFSAPQLRFLTGKPLERLRDGNPVGFAWQITLSLDGLVTPWRRVPGRFVISYDLWEEKFTVTRIGLNTASVSHLSAAAAEAWCLENMVVGSAGLAPDKQFWARLDLRVEDARPAAGVVGESGINITRLIELFSRPAAPSNPHWSAAAGPLRLADLRRPRGTRGG